MDGWMELRDVGQGMTKTSAVPLVRRGDDCGAEPYGTGGMAKSE